VITFLKRYIAFVDAFNYRVGRIVMYGIFVLMLILLWSSTSKIFLNPSLWTLEMAQFVMVAYYILGGPYAMQLGADVRMDLFYGLWSTKTKAWVDAFTVFFLIFYLGVLLYGGLDSLAYSFQYGERSATTWRPYLWPITLFTCFGFLLMILQALSEFFKDILILRGQPFRKGDL
jgi:TRAP-type mannitol/chloroaromatic compound transport system permease small subunit